ncbi:hypothetical protein [Planobispora takensis]|uniref:Secreted protein n=1 Tax=Planobispora takensis TaxID=1367882 RepID=A0A8J3WUQ7_9ACTN|nr:hypothetical protein [Planobispora takensis]GII03174.1 hypothetical protein Pta02_51820 [Planobispora takensis]
MNGVKIRNVLLVAALVVGGGGAAASAAVAGEDDGKAFAACMSSHGLPEFPEVTFSPDGTVVLAVKGERVDLLSSEYGTAVRACESLLPAWAHLPAPPEAHKAVKAPELSAVPAALITVPTAPVPPVAPLAPAVLAVLAVLGALAALTRTGSHRQRNTTLGG